MGGSDQWGNIVTGIELARRIDGRQLFGLTTPLITTASGAKMGKTAAGAVWLTADRLSPYEYWQFWRNTEDADVGRFLRLFTELPLAEIARLERLQGAEINEAKKVLRDEATRLAHGEAARAAAAETARPHVRGRGRPARTCRQSRLAATELDAGLPAFELFRRAGLAASNGEARRLIRGGGARLNDAPVAEETRAVSCRRPGRRRHAQALGRQEAARDRARRLSGPRAHCVISLSPSPASGLTQPSNVSRAQRRKPGKRTVTGLTDTCGSSSGPATQ